MAFNVSGFSSAKFEHRTATVPVPDLADWFPKGAAKKDMVFTVRAISGIEIAKSQEATQKAAQAQKIVEAIARNSEKENVESVLSIMGLDNETPEDIAKRIEQVMAGCVEPKMDRHAVVKLFTWYPIVAYQVSNKILELTGKGATVGKPKASTRKKTSEQH